ncbi:hypothetical protein MAR_028684 [Mya arenaria]|uniref:Uncharacterized protein n=1 Tax=Mya arenaria TaxID=6604 RepID=A0ABY7DFE2_MYAAR|nr:hypothetical protein MAR_028684 [Mya arenaria]
MVQSYQWFIEWSLPLKNASRGHLPSFASITSIREFAPDIHTGRHDISHSKIVSINTDLCVISSVEREYINFSLWTKEATSQLSGKDMRWITSLMYQNVYGTCTAVLLDTKEAVGLSVRYRSCLSCFSLRDFSHIKRLSLLWRYRYCSEGCCPEEYCAYKLICYPKICCTFGGPDSNCHQEICIPN